MEKGKIPANVRLMDLLPNPPIGLKRYSSQLDDGKPLERGQGLVRVLDEEEMIERLRTNERMEKVKNSAKSAQSNIRIGEVRYHFDLEKVRREQARKDYERHTVEENLRREKTALRESFIRRHRQSMMDIED